MPRPLLPLALALALFSSPLVAARAGDDDDKDKDKERGGTDSGLADLVKAFLTERGASTDAKTSDAVTKLLGRLSTVEGERDELKRKLAAVKETPEGAVVLTGDDAEAYRALEKGYADVRSSFDDAPEQFTPKAVADALKAGAEARTKAAAADRAATVTKGAKVAGVENVDLLNSLSGFDRIPVEVEGEGDDAKAFALVEKDGKTTKVDLGEHLRAAYPGAADALFTEPAKGGPGSDRSLPKQGMAGGNTSRSDGKAPAARPRVSV